MLANSGASISRLKRSNSSWLSKASGKIQSAASGQVSLGPLDGVVQRRYAAASVRATITKSGLRRAAAAARSLAHLSGWHQRFSDEVPAAFGEPLVFKLNGGGAGGFQFTDGPLDVQRFAESRVGIDDHRYVNGTCEPRGLLGQLGEREQADVG